MACETPSSRSIVVKSIPSNVGAVCKQILSELEANNFSKEDGFAVQLALHEAFLNALKHGNKMDASKEVKIDYSIDSDRVELSITDEGEGFNPDGVPDPRVGKNLYRADGRGLLLMRSYMDEVKFNSEGNCVCMTRYKEKPQVTKT
ncbi:MAG: ATP-binding protein [Planctomycetota bacterium]